MTNFAKAFAQARKAGQKTFIWRGRTYGTELAEDNTSANSNTRKEGDRVFSGTQTMPNNISFAKAFSRARYRNLNTFKWRGREYGTELSDNTPTQTTQEGNPSPAQTNQDSNTTQPSVTTNSTNATIPPPAAVVNNTNNPVKNTTTIYTPSGAAITTPNFKPKGLPERTPIGLRGYQPTLNGQPWRTNQRPPQMQSGNTQQLKNNPYARSTMSITDIVNDAWNETPIRNIQDNRRGLTPSSPGVKRQTPNSKYYTRVKNGYKYSYVLDDNGYLKEIAKFKIK